MTSALPTAVMWSRSTSRPGTIAGGTLSGDRGHCLGKRAAARAESGPWSESVAATTISRTAKRAPRITVAPPGDGQGRNLGVYITGAIERGVPEDAGPSSPWWKSSEIPRQQRGRNRTVRSMAMGKRKSEQTPMWVPTSALPVSPGHPFYAKLNAILDEAGFDQFVERQCDAFYAPVMGRPSLAPGRYFRLLLVGYFEGIDSERGIAWRAADSL